MCHAGKTNQGSFLCRAGKGNKPRGWPPPTCSQLHWSLVKHILRYLQGIITHGLLLYRYSPRQLHAFSDADWAGNNHDRRSTSGYTISLERNLISWSSTKQATVARSSTDEEYKAVANATAELIWLQALLQEVNLPSLTPVLWCDNIGATCLAANPVFHAHTKHIEIDFHFVREHVAAKQLLVSYISTHDQRADALTKPLSHQRFTMLHFELNVVKSPLVLRGHNIDRPDTDLNESVAHGKPTTKSITHDTDSDESVKQGKTTTMKSINQNDHG